MQLKIHRYTLRLAHPFGISRSVRTTQESLIVELEEKGLRGYGEATANAYYGVSIAQMEQALENVRPIIESTPVDPPEAYWAALQPSLKEHPFALCALDEAANDLFGKKQGRPLHQIWGYNPAQTPLSSYTIGIDTLDKMVEKLKEKPWPVYKIKLGTDRDLEIIQTLRGHTDAAFRIDANCAWTAEQTVDISHRLKELGVEFIEQPLPADDWEGMKKVYAESALPVLADESCRGESDVARCQGHFHGINIKLMKCGGLTPARRMIKEAKSLGLQLMIGCMCESSVGISAIAQLLPRLDYVDMDGALLLKEDIASGVRLEYGRAILPDAPGTGVRLLYTPHNTNR